MSRRPSGPGRGGCRPGPAGRGHARPAASGWVEKRASWKRRSSSPTGRGSTSRRCRNRTTNSVAVSAGRRPTSASAAASSKSDPALDDPVAYVGPGERLALSLVVALDGGAGRLEVRQRLERQHEPLREPAVDAGEHVVQQPAEQQQPGSHQPGTPPGPATQAANDPASPGFSGSVVSVGGLPGLCRIGGRLDLHRLTSSSPRRLADDLRGSGRGRPDQQERDPQRRHGDGDGAAQARGHPVTVPTVTVRSRSWTVRRERRPAPPR